MLRQSAPIVLVAAGIFIGLEAFKVGNNRISFGWLGVFLIVLYVFLSQLIP